MLEVNKVYKFKIIDVGINFEGIAKSEEGLTIFIEGALLDEIVEAKILKINKSFAVGKLINIVEKSNLRDKSDCNYYERCGACLARHTIYENTLDIKTKYALNTLEKQGIDISKFKCMYGMGNPFYYRNKVQYPVRNINGRNVIGMFEKATHNIIENKTCLIQNKEINEVALKLFDIINEEKFLGYDEFTCLGDIRNILIRKGIHTGQIMCVIVVNNRNIISDERLKKIVDKIIKVNDNITSIVLNINDKNTNVILTDENICIYGKNYITDYIGEYEFRITPNSFFQVNTIQAEVLYNVLKEQMHLDKSKTLLELYSGVGSIGIFLSDEVKNVYSVEIVESAVKAAKENANINNVLNIINVEGDATKETLKLVNEGRYFNYIVVDPPRKGLDLEGIELILKLKPEKIGYVSCNVATLARDIKLLSQSYDVKSINFVDMFPWTNHVECCALLCLK